MGDLARLGSPLMAQVTPHCLSFYYSMYGDQVGSLNLYLRVNGITSLNPLWTRSGNQGEAWIKGQTTIQAAAPYQVKHKIPTVMQLYTSH